MCESELLATMHLICTGCIVRENFTKFIFFSLFLLKRAVSAVGPADSLVLLLVIGQPLEAFRLMKFEICTITEPLLHLKSSCRHPTLV